MVLVPTQYLIPYSGSDRGILNCFEIFLNIWGRDKDKLVSRHTTFGPFQGNSISAP